MMAPPFTSVRFLRPLQPLIVAGNQGSAGQRCNRLVIASSHTHPGLLPGLFL